MTIGSRRRIDRAHLQQVIPEYRDATSEDAFERMFERDKAEIIQLGIPLRSETDVWGETVYYAIDAGGGTDLDLTGEEYTILLAASRAWDDAMAGGAARRIRAKLLSMGQDADPDLLRRTPRGSLESLPVLSPLLDAVTTGGTVSFQYRSTRGDRGLRTVEPWSVATADGHWYLYGYDRDRQAPRLFRASRLESFPRDRGRAREPRPEQVDISTVLASIDASDDQAEATLEVIPYKAQGLRARAGADAASSRITLPRMPRPAVRRAVLAEVRWTRVLEPAAWAEDVAEALDTISALHREAPDLEAVERAVPHEQPRIRATSSGPEHLSRLIAIASYVLGRGEADLDELAAVVGLQRKELIRDLELLFVCGDLGNGFEDLIDVVWEHDVVRVHNADPLRRSLRLNAAETTALLAGLAALEPVGGAEAEILASARRKLTAAVEDAPELPGDSSSEPDRALPHQSTVAVPAGRDAPIADPEQILVRLQQALREDGAVTVRHSSPARAGTTVRRLHPLALETDGARSYLRARCELVGDERSFRVDRIVEVLPDDTPQGEQLAAGEQSGAESAETVPLDGRVHDPVWLRLDGPAQWIAEAFDAAERREMPAQGAECAGGTPSDQQSLWVRLEEPVRVALVDAVLEAAGSAELLAPGDMRDTIETTARDRASRQRSR